MTDQNAQKPDQIEELAQFHQEVMDNALVKGTEDDGPEEQLHWKDCNANALLDEYSKIDDPRIPSLISEIGNAHDQSYGQKALEVLRTVHDKVTSGKFVSMDKSAVETHMASFAEGIARACVLRRDGIYTPAFVAVTMLGDLENSEKALLTVYASLQSQITTTPGSPNERTGEDNRLLEHILETLVSLNTDEAANTISRIHHLNHSRNGADGLHIVPDETLIELIYGMSNPKAPEIIANIGSPDFEETGLEPKTAQALSRLVDYFNTHASGKEKTPQLQAVKTAIVDLVTATALNDPEKFRTALDGGLTKDRTISYKNRPASDQTVHELKAAFEKVDNAQIFSRKITPRLEAILSERQERAERLKKEHDANQTTIGLLKSELIM